MRSWRPWHKPKAFLFALVGLALQRLALAGYLGSFQAELLAPAVGAQDYLWIGFRTSSDEAFVSIDEPFHTLVVTGRGLSFSDCSSVLELSPSTWPRPISCNAGVIQLDNALGSDSWYEMVLLVNVIATPHGDSVQVGLRIGRNRKVPVDSLTEITFFESSVRDVEAEASTFPVGAKLDMASPDCYVDNFEIVHPTTFVPANTSLSVQMRLRSRAGVNSTSVPCTVLLFARPFLIWSLQPETQDVASIRGVSTSASCLGQLSGPLLPTECIWVCFGSRAGSPSRANGLKLLFRAPQGGASGNSTVPLLLHVTLQTRTPPLGSFEPWLVVMMQNSTRTAPPRRTDYAGRGLAVPPVPAVEMLSYSFQGIAGRNDVRVRIQPGVTVHGTQEVDRDAQGHLRLILPEGSGEIVSCSLEPQEVWGTLRLSQGVQFRSWIDVAGRSCTLPLRSPEVQFYALIDYVIKVTFYNSLIASEARENVWSLELRNAGQLSMPRGTVHVHKFQQSFDVIGHFREFRVALSRLDVTTRDPDDIRSSAEVRLALDETEVDFSLGTVGCLRLSASVACAFVAEGTQCGGFQTLVGLPPGTRCVVEGSNSVVLSLPPDSATVARDYYAFALQLWNPSALAALRGEDTAAWKIEARHGDRQRCDGRLHAARRGHQSPNGDYPVALYPHAGWLPAVAASSLAPGAVAIVTLHFMLQAPVAPGSHLLVSAPRDFRWDPDGLLAIGTSATQTGAAKSWDLQAGPSAAELGDADNELLLRVAGAGIEPMSEYGISARAFHPSASEYERAGGSTEPRRWLLEAFYIPTGQRPGLGYRANPVVSLPFRQRVAAATGVGYSLLGLAACEVLPSDNRMRQITPVRIHFRMATSLDAPLVLRVEPPLGLVFQRPCKVLPNVLSDQRLPLAREPLKASGCTNDVRDRYVLLHVVSTLLADVPYFVDVHSLEMAATTPSPSNDWRLAVGRLPAGVSDDAPLEEESSCSRVAGFPSAWPLPRASVLTDGVRTSPRSWARSKLFFVFSVPEPSVADYTIALSGPVGAGFAEDCSSDVDTAAASPLASAPLPGSLVQCRGSGGVLPDRAQARMRLRGAAAGGLLTTEMYGFAIHFTNGRYVEGLRADLNSWRLEVGDEAWNFGKAVASGLYAYDLMPHVSLGFLISDQISTDPSSLLGANHANITVQFQLPEKLPAGLELVLNAPTDSFQFVQPCQLSHSNQIQWVPAVDALVPGAPPPKRLSKLSSSVFTGTCMPSCVSLGDPHAKLSCQAEPRVLRVVLAEALKAATPYCFAVAVRSPDAPWDGAGLWTLEIRSNSTLLGASLPTSGPVAGAFLIPSKIRGLSSEGDVPFAVFPSTRARAALAVSLRVIFTLPAPARHGALTFVTPVVGGPFSGPVGATAVSSGSALSDVHEVALAPGSGEGRAGRPFFDFNNACESIDTGSVGSIGALPRPLECRASARAVSLVVTTSGAAGYAWEAYREYRLVLVDVPAGMSTGAVDLFGGDELPPFRLLLLESEGQVVASGQAPGWRWTPELELTRLRMHSPLLRSPPGTTTLLELHVVLSTAMRAGPGRLRLRPPSHVSFEWRSGVAPASVGGAGDGDECSENPKEISVVGASSEEEGKLLCRSVRCHVRVVTESGEEIDLPHCRATPTWAGCCYSAARPGKPVFAQLLVSPESRVLPASARVEVTFEEVTTSAGAAAAAASDDSEVDGTSWNITTAAWVPTVCQSTEATPSPAICAEGAEVDVNDPGSYVTQDEASDAKLILYPSFVRASAVPTHRTVSYEKNRLQFIFELPADLPRFGASLTVVAPPGTLFRGGPGESGDFDRRALPPALQGELSGRPVQPLPPGFQSEMSGPILKLSLYPRLSGALLAHVIYGFVATADNPHVRPRREDNRWIFRTAVVGANGETDPSTAFWAEAPSYVLQGGVPSLSIFPSTRLPLYPRNELLVTFILSLPLGRADYSSESEEWLPDERASRVLLLAPEGFLFPESCEAPGGLYKADAGIAQLGAEMKALPPPWACLASTAGSFSNATLLLRPTDDPHSGQLVQDQLYGVRLLVYNPLYDPGQLKKDLGNWRLMTRWGESKLGGFVTLHDEQVGGFPIDGLVANVAPGSLEPDAFHALNVSFEPRAPVTPTAGTSQLGAIVLVAPRGLELSCVGFLPGTAGRGRGEFGWLDSSRIACSETDRPIETGPCAMREIPLPKGLWTLCLTYVERPPYPPERAAQERNSTGEVSGDSEARMDALWFVVGAVNPAYLPTDNLWALVLLGVPPEGDTVGAPFIDASEIKGYPLMRAPEDAP